MQDDDDEGRDPPADDATEGDGAQPEAQDVAGPAAHATAEGADAAQASAATAPTGTAAVRVVVAGAPGSSRSSRRTTHVPLNIKRGSDFSNPFPMGQSGCDGAWREECVELHRRWLIDGQTMAHEMRMPDGAALPAQLRPRPSEASMTGDGVMQA